MTRLRIFVFLHYTVVVPLLSCLINACKEPDPLNRGCVCVPLLTDGEWEARRPRAQQHHGALASAVAHGAVHGSDAGHRSRHLGRHGRHRGRVAGGLWPGPVQGSWGGSHCGRLRCSLHPLRQPGEEGETGGSGRSPSPLAASLGFLLIVQMLEMPLVVRKHVFVISSRVFWDL